LVTASFSSVMTSPSHGVPLASFFPLKALTSGVVFYGLYADTGRMYVSVCLCVCVYVCVCMCMCVCIVVQYDEGDVISADRSLSSGC
jgi:thiamine transporter ThiT